MVSLDDAVVVRLKTHGETYEIFVDADKALDYKSGQDVDLDEVLAADHVFKDAKKGDKASEEHIFDLFKVKDLKEAIKQILTKGDLHLTTEQKKKMHAERKKQVASIIAQNAINPQTKAPHPLSRIEAAMEEARAEVVISKTAKEQVDKVVKVIKPILPIRFEMLELAVKIPAAYAGKMYKVIHEFGTVKKDDWVGGEQYVLVEIPAGMQDEFYSQLNNMTHGEVKTKVVEHDKR